MIGGSAVNMHTLKCVLVLLVSIALSGCTKVTTDTEAVTTDTEAQEVAVQLHYAAEESANGSPDIYQLRLQFNTPIALPGALPSLAQIAAIEVNGDYFPGCSWRFLNTETLACELHQALPIHSEFSLQVAAGFPTLAGKLTQPVEFMLSTISTLDKSVVNQSGFSVSIRRGRATENPNQLTVDIQYFPSEDRGVNTNEWFTFLQRHLEVQTPAGNTQALSGEQKETEFYISWHAAYGFTQEGLYHVQLPAGIYLPGSNQALAEPLVLERFRVYQQLQVLAMRCLSNSTVTGRLFGEEVEESGDWAYQFEQDYGRADVQLNCPTGAIELLLSHASNQVFAMPTAHRSFGYPLEQHAGFSHPVAILPRRIASDAENLSILTLLPLPNQAYRLNVAELWHENLAEHGLQLPPAAAEIHFTSGDLADDWWPAWYLPTYSDSKPTHYVGVVSNEVPAQASVRSKQQAVALTIQRVTSAANLLAQLQGRLREEPYIWRLHGTPDNNVFTLPVTQLIAEGGVITVAGRDTLAEKPGIMQYNGFQLSAFTVANQWVVQTWYQRERPLAGAAVSQVCASAEEPLLLGYTNDHGLLIAEYGEVNEADECWLWASAETDDGKQRHASMALFTPPEIVQPNMVVGSIIASQRILRSEDQPYFLIEVAGRFADTEIATEQVRVQLRQDTQIIPLELTASSNYGLLSATLPAEKSLAYGTYFAELYYQDELLQRTIIYVTSFVPPEASLSAEAEVTITANPWWQINGELTRISQAALSEQAVTLDVHFSASPYIHAPNTWPQEWNYRFQVEHDSQSSNFRQQVNVVTDAFGQFSAVLQANDTANPNSMVQAPPQVFGRLHWNVATTAINGEALEDYGSDNLYGFAHYPAYQHWPNREGFTLRVINRSGNWDSVPVQAQLYSVANEPELLGSCAANETAEATELLCWWPQGQENARVEVQIADQQFSTRVTQPAPADSQQPTLVLASSLVHGPKGSRIFQPLPASVDSENTANLLSITSPISQPSTLMIFSDQLVHSESVHLHAGENNFSVHPQPEWGASIRVVLAHPDHRSGAFLSSSAHVVASAPPLAVSLEVAHTALQVGDSLQVTFSSNHDSDIQWWLVDQRLVQSHAATIPAIDQLNRFKGSSWQHYSSTFLMNRSRVLATSAPALYSDVWQPSAEEHIQVTGARYRTPAAAYSVDAGLGGELSAQGRFAQQLVLWQPLLALTAGSSETITLPLPPVASQWQLVAVAVTAEQRQIINETINVTAPFEFSIAAAQHSYEGDQLLLAVTATQRGQQAAEQQLLVALNGEPLQPLTLALAAGESIRQTVALPPLPVGQHLLTVHYLGERSAIATENLARLAANSVQTRALSVQVQAPYREQWQRFAPEPLAHSTTIVLPSYAREPQFFLQTGTLSVNWPQFEAHFTQQRQKSLAEQLNYALLIALQHTNISPELQRDEIANIMQRVATTYKNQSAINLYPLFFASDNAELVAYTNWVLQQIAQQGFGPQVAELQGLIASRVQTVLEHSANENAQALALLSLSQGLTVDAFQQLASHITSSANPRSRLLYLASLRHWQAQMPAAYQQLQHDIQRQAYHGTEGPIFGGAQNQCLAILAGIPQVGSETIIMQQHQYQHFGDVFADGYCMVALANSSTAPLVVEPLVAAQLVAEQRVVAQATAEGHWQVPNPNHQPIIVRYQVTEAQLPASAEGLRIQRSYERRVGINSAGEPQWQPLAANATLQVGDQIRITLGIHAPVALNHVRVQNRQSGAAYTPPNQFNSWRRYCMFGCHTDSSPEQVMWYLRELSAGYSELQYETQIRNAGTFLVPGASIELMHESELRGRTSSHWWVVE